MKIPTRVKLSNKYAAEWRPSRLGASFAKSTARIRMLVWGIKGGKSRRGAWELVKAGLGTPGGVCWAVAPTYNHLKVAEREVVMILRVIEESIGIDLTMRRHRARHEIDLVNGCVLEFQSAENPDSLRGPNLDAVWIDEASWIRDEAWHIIRGRVAATEGEIWITTTPRGRNWVWEEAQRAGMPGSADYGEWETVEVNPEDPTRPMHRWISHRPTWSFPWVPRAEIDDARKSMPKMIFDQEYGAAFLAESASVFRRIEESLSLERPKEGGVDLVTVMGCDLAKHQDFTALNVMDPTGRELWVDRWNDVDWAVQRPRIIEASKKWNSVIVLDASNVGSVIIEDLREAGCEVFGVDLNNASLKLELIQALQVAFERSNLKLIDHRAEHATPAVKARFDELKWYEHKLTRTGKVSYSAPRGLHDDCVVALALANWGRVRGYAGSIEPASVEVGRAEYETRDQHVVGRRRRSGLPSSVFNNRRSRIFGDEGLGGRPFWG